MTITSCTYGRVVNRHNTYSQVLDEFNAARTDRQRRIVLNVLRSRCEKTHSSDSFVVSSEDGYVLISKIRDAKDGALNLAFASLGCFDGGDREDIWRAIGQLVVREVKAVMQAARAEKVQAEIFGEVSSSLPLELVDQTKSQLDEVNARIYAFERLDTDQNSALVKSAVARLNKQRLLLLQMLGNQP